MAKAKTKTPVDPNAGRLQMPDLQWMETPEEKAETQKAQGTDTESQLKALQDQIAKLSGDLENQRSANIAMMSQPMVQAPAQAPKLDMSGLPDPTLEPEAYAAAVAQRTTAYIGAVEQQRQQAGQAAASESKRVEALWEDFTEKYPQYADQNEQVEYVATKVAQRAAARGLDVNKYIFGASGVFMSDVAKEMEKVFGKGGTAEAEDDEPDNRTAGLSGGQESGGRAVEPEEKRMAFAPNSMFGGIQEWQAKTGFTR